MSDNRSPARGAVGCLFFIPMLAIVIWLFSGSGDSGKAGAETPTSKSTPTIGVGQTGIVTMNYWGPSNHDDKTEVLHELEARDFKGLLQMALEGRAGAVNQGDTVVLLDSDWTGYVLVRVARSKAGPDAEGLRVWIPREIVK